MMNTAGAKTIQVSINGTSCSVLEGSTILEAAREQGISIPTLCHDPRLESYGSCWVCVVKVEGAKGFVPSCATKVRQGMKIITDDDEVLAARKMAFELILSNHYGDCKAPCTLACPSNIDVQGYVGLISHGKSAEALRLIKKDNPFPAVCGRVCPRPCEEACRRNLVDEPVAIDYLKRHVADKDLFSDKPWLPACMPKNGKKAAVIGGGPAGLSAAWFLRLQGTDVKVYEAQEKAGGMLRYGIPDYRLPQDVLDSEIALIVQLGVEIEYGQTLGKNLDLKKLLTENDAVILALGAWNSRDLRIKGEELPGVVSGIGILHEVACGNRPGVGAKVAVVGGGNTAIDAARTSLRLGADDVQIFYRRSRNEMPASSAEIEEALDEGVHITYLAAPTAITQGENSGLELHLIKMELGEPDASGRQRPVPVAGSDFSWRVDTVISAVGQYTDASSFIGIEGLVDEKGNIISDAQTGATPVEKLFAAGDLVTGPDIAIRAIAGGKFAAASIEQFFSGIPIDRKNEFLSKKEYLKPVAAEDLEDEEKIPRAAMAMIPLESRQRSFSEIELGYSDEQAIVESGRCLQCGCQDVHECKLKQYAEEYGASATRFIGDFHIHTVDESHPFIIRDPSKCILCGRCVRICDEVQGLGVLGYVKRGFDSVIEPSFSKPFGDVDLCINCGQCVSACPVGALTEKYSFGKTVPLEEDVREGFCPMCSVNCPVEYRSHGSLFTRVTERVDGYGGTLCERGRFKNHFVLGADADKAYTFMHDGKSIDRDEADRHLKSYLQHAGMTLMRLSPFLSGDVIDYMIDKAMDVGCVVQPIGLGTIHNGWLELNTASESTIFESRSAMAPGRQSLNPESRYFFEDTSTDSRHRAVIILGTLADSNNVAFTEAYRMKREGFFSLWIVGDDGPAARRVSDRHFPKLSSLEDALRYAQIEHRMVDILVNPEEVHKCCERDMENRLIQTIADASTWQKIRTTLFWNARNSWYLIKSIQRNGALRGDGRRSLEDFGLVLDVGGDLIGTDKQKTVRWGGKPDGADLFIPVPLEYWIEGYSEPSGRKPVRTGHQTTLDIRNSLLI